jgi:hypothetical protein
MNTYINSLSNLGPVLHKSWVAGCFHRRTEQNEGYDPIVSAMADAKQFIDYDYSILKGDFDSYKKIPDLEDADDMEKMTGVKDDLNSQNDRSLHYCHGGNHDVADSEPYKLLIDSFGANPIISGVVNANRPFPIVQLTEHDYYIDKGHSRILMISDRNEYPWPIGFTNRPENDIPGGLGSGAISLETFLAIKHQIETFKGNIFIEIHQGLYNTTIGTGYMDGTNGNFHGKSGLEPYSGVMATIMDESTMTPSTGNSEIMNLLRDTPSHTVVSVRCVHTHHNIGERFPLTGPYSKGFRRTKYGTECINAGQVTKHAGLPGFPKHRSSWQNEWYSDRIVHTRLLHEEVTINGVVYPKGFYLPDQFVTKLKVAI